MKHNLNVNDKIRLQTDTRVRVFPIIDDEEKFLFALRNGVILGGFRFLETLKQDTEAEIIDIIVIAHPNQSYKKLLLKIEDRFVEVFEHEIKYKLL